LSELIPDPEVFDFAGDLNLGNGDTADKADTHPPTAADMRPEPGEKKAAVQEYRTMQELEELVAAFDALEDWGDLYFELRK
jgi:hypothetical protein